eukprot:CAMPEP_0170147420 /NCGR_PEP_ID=MMETSP0033_2-20121228/34345_1 /TAXON_ID=195969 /ORGANISM="Dolichomastix tenuilepis, Strain CCMP3274" /LENGTH=41 /DNA_ID= /DNA_START= /DNA_END= /DNA_ORIENTATION=
MSKPRGSDRGPMRPIPPAAAPRKVAAGVPAPLVPFATSRAR